MGTLWHGGKIRTLRRKDETCEALYVENGVITDIGSSDELRRLYENHISEEINLEGAVMYPGFVDSHLHMIGHGEKILKLDVSEVTSLAELKLVLTKAASSLPEGEWLLAEGFNENLYEYNTVPDRFVLDEVSTKHPIMVTRVCRHAIVTNSYGLNLAGVTADSIDPPGGLIEKDESGIPTGYLHDQAQELVREHIPEKGFDYIEKALITSLNDLYAKGYTGAHTEDLNYYGNAKKTLQTFKKVIDGSVRKFRANLLVHHEAAPQILDMRKEIENEFLELGSVKIFADGALGGRTALLSEPYTDAADTQGVAIHTPGQLEGLIKEARAYGMPVAIHVIGDLALEYAISAIEEHPVSLGKRDRLIHLQVTRKDLIERLKKLPVVLDIQPRFVASDFPWVESRLGEKRLSCSFAWRTLIESGLVCAGGSDAPIEPIDPMLGIHAAVTRRKPGEKHEGYNAKEKLSLYETLQLFTSGSAKAISKENDRGVIAPGFKADFTVLDADLFELQPDDWLNVKVVKTVVDNTIMYDEKETAHPDQ
ncbi:amidohydrolase [Salipaludibacillus aurantiacus]|uniref:Amidohydrolase 3 domain-containing protein n=1 Tax=Salipaludibacillus aurantiacus TaxID=1601833 RepID=A0A1H9WP27_9BACI|nr:amidohydrolase [Salipaludibacillus aurantiacus]SES35571.1 hypothetical protein SAMN05518684_11870 [Salipaludibacillus aurantiacus]